MNAAAVAADLMADLKAGTIDRINIDLIRARCYRALIDSNSAMSSRHFEQFVSRTLRKVVGKVG